MPASVAHGLLCLCVRVSLYAKTAEPIETTFGAAAVLPGPKEPYKIFTIGRHMEEGASLSGHSFCDHSRDVAMTTDFVTKFAKFVDPPSFGTLAFRNGLLYRKVDLSTLNGNDFSMLLEIFEICSSNLKVNDV